MGECNLWCCSEEHDGIVFPLVPGTKQPAVKWREVRRGQYHAVGNYGVALSASMLVLDFDCHKPDGHASLERFFKRYPDLRTRIVQTPRGGYHVYLKKPPELKLKQRQPAWPGVDFQTEGRYVVGPGSQTIAGKDSAQGAYSLLGDAKIVYLPA